MGPDAGGAGTGTILLVEDDASLRKVVTTTFRRRGYEVVEAELAWAGLERLREARGAIDLVLTDVSLWPRGSDELLEARDEHLPDAAVLFMSGYRRDELVDRGLLRGDEAFVKKPFQPSDLARRVEELLAGD